MIVIYHDAAGCLSSIIAANIHINRLPVDRVPERYELLSIPPFENIAKAQIGKLVYIGQDELRAKVYALSFPHKTEFVIPAIKDLYKILNGSPNGLILTDTSASVNKLIKFGGYLNQISLCRPMALRGTLKAYPQIVNIVSNTKEEMLRNIR